MNNCKPTFAIPSICPRLFSGVIHLFAQKDIFSTYYMLIQCKAWLLTSEGRSAASKGVQAAFKMVTQLSPTSHALLQCDAATITSRAGVCFATLHPKSGQDHDCSNRIFESENSLPYFWKPVPLHQGSPILLGTRPQIRR